MASPHIAAAASATLLVATSPAVAQSASLRLGTTPEGGGFAPYTVALVETLKSIDRGLVIRSLDTNGSTDNAERLKAGSLDLGLMSGEVFNESETRQPGRLKVISVMYYTPGMFAVLNNSPHRSIMDLRGAPIVWGPRGTGSAVQARYVMAGLGLDMDHVVHGEVRGGALMGPIETRSLGGLPVVLNVGLHLALIQIGALHGTKAPLPTQFLCQTTYYVVRPG